MVAIVRSLQRADIKTHGSVTVADAGEEGLGDLRGMKQLFGDTLKGKVDRFVSIDGGIVLGQYGGGQPPDIG